MQQTICWDLSEIDYTLNVSILLTIKSNKVKINSIISNQQVTKMLSTLVGTSEAIRLLSNNNDISKFNQWLAG